MSGYIHKNNIWRRLLIHAIPSILVKETTEKKKHPAAWFDGNTVTLRATLYHNGYQRQRSAWNNVCLGVTGTLFVEAVVHFCQAASYTNVSHNIVLVTFFGHFELDQ